jgi:hypothetical protein
MGEGWMVAKIEMHSQLAGSEIQNTTLANLYINLITYVVCFLIG